MADNVKIDESSSVDATLVDSDETTKDGTTVKRQRVALAPAVGTSTLSNVNSATSSTTLLASNVDRLRATIVNDSTAILYVKEGTSASATSYSWKLGPGDTLLIDDTTGTLTGIWASANGAARVTEVA